MTTTFDIDEIERLLAAATPGEWKTEYDPIGDDDHATAICLPRKVGGFGTFLASCQHNWNDAAYDERRISWKEATANAALIVAARNSLPAMITELRELRAENARLKEITATNKQAWDNALELGLIPERHRNTVQIMSDGCRAALGEPQ